MTTATAPTWIPREPEATEAMIAAVESALGVCYPASFRAVAPRAHGAEPSPAAFRYRHPRLGPVETGLDRMLSFDPDSMFYVLKSVEALGGEGILPALVVPFGEDAGGDLMAFDFRKDATDPPIVYVATTAATENDESHIYPLAPSFTDFLALLTEG